jgi:hypothetical protein
MGSFWKPNGFHHTTTTIGLSHDRVDEVFISFLGKIAQSLLSTKHQAI